jgi:hypothetical protein
VKLTARQLAPRIVVAALIVLTVASFVFSDALYKVAFRQFVSTDDDAIGRHYITLLQAREVMTIERSLEKSLRTPDTRKSLLQAADLLPKGSTDVELVGYNKNATDSAMRFSLTYELHDAHAWALVAISWTKPGDDVILDGFRVYPRKESMEYSNRLTFEGKDFAHYMWMFTTSVIALFVAVTLVLCAWEPYVRLRWLWMFLLCLGVAQFSMNWTTGETEMFPVSILLPSVSLKSAGTGAPWIVTFALPIGAVLYWIFHEKLVKKPETTSNV